MGGRGGRSPSGSHPAPPRGGAADIERIVGDAVDGAERRLRDEMHTLFDALAQGMDRLETEYATVKAGMQRIEERLDRREQMVDEMALRSELLDLKARVDGLQRGPACWKPASKTEDTDSRVGRA